MEGGRVLSTKQQLFPRLKAAEGEREEVPRWSQHESLDSKRKGEEIAPCCCSIAAHHCSERESESRDRRCMIRAH